MANLEEQLEIDSCPHFSRRAIMESSSLNEPELSPQKRLQQVGRKLGWSFWGVVLASIFGGLFIYCEFIRDKHPQLRYEILTNTSVFDVKEEVGTFSVLFDGVDIRQKELSLRVITVRVLNNSSVDILKGYYDERTPLGLTISKGKIVKYELLSTSNEYLTDNMKLKTEGEKVIHFPNLIVEARESFTIKLLVLHSKNDLPTVEPIGKVAGIKEIQVLKPYEDEGKTPFLRQVFEGSFLVQLTRMVSYAIAAIILILGIGFPISAIGTFREKLENKKTVKAFKSETTLKLGQADESIFEYYYKQKQYYWGIVRLHNTTSLLSRLTQKDEKAHEPNGTGGESNLILLDKSKLEEEALLWDVHQMNNCLRLGLLKRTEYGLAVDSHLMHTVEHFMSFLQDRGLLGIHEDDDKKSAIEKKSFLDSIPSTKQP